MKRIISILTLFFVAIAVATANITFTVDGPRKVVQGQQFKLEFIVEGSGKGQIDLPSFPGCKELYTGDAYGSNVTIDNGKINRSEMHTVTVTLRAVDEGTHEIGAATFTVDGKSYKTKPFTLTVLPQDEPATGGSGSADQATTSNSEVFALLNLSATKVYENEAILATLKVYSNSTGTQITDVNIPTFEGFSVQELDVPQSFNWDMERYRNRNYATAVLRQMWLFPQRTGEITISDIDIEVETYGRPYQTMFGIQYERVARTVKAPAVKVNVKQLPQDKPLNFIGGVGNFQLSSELSALALKANEALTYKLIIEGTGNLQLLQTPAIEFPAEFESYDPNATVDVTATRSGVTGKRVIEYTLIPRYAGTFTIPAIDISYFDISEKKYKTLSTQPYTVEVGEGDASNVTVSNFNDKEDVRLLNADIRHIKMSQGHLTSQHTTYLDSFTYWLWYVIPVLLVVVCAIALRMYKAANADVAANRLRKANKVALRRLKQAGIYLKQHNETLFYEEVLRAVWGYLGDKLAMPVADLSRDKIQEQLDRYGVTQEIISRFTAILDRCEFARYAPAQAEGAMEQLYQETLDTIGLMENTINAKKN